MINKIKKIFKKINESFKFHLSKKISGLKIVHKEYGFILSYLSHNYFSFVLRPKKSYDFNLVTTSKYKRNKFAIILQGPLGEDGLFLIETIKIYKKIFPNCRLVLSTWNTENKKLIENIKLLDIDIILNDLPQSPGNGNINYQLKNTFEAIKYCKTKNVEYIFKTRTDCRVLKPNTLDYLESIIEKFPAENNKLTKFRIIANSIATCKYRIYGLTDICLFGKTEDIENFFYYEDELEIIKKNNFPKNKLVNETHIKAEILLTARYLKKIGHNLEWTLEDWWLVLKKYFCVVSAAEIDFFWKKYNWQYEQKLSRSYSSKSNRLIEFSDWFSLYSDKSLNWGDINYKEKWEEIEGKVYKKSIF